MKLSQKKNCEGCRAVILQAGSRGRCELGFNNHGPYLKEFGVYRLQPQEPCYKPKTYDELLKATRLVKTSE